MSDSKPQDQQPDDELIVTPINIARARHASSHGKSVVHNDTRRMPSTPTPSQPQPSTAQAAPSGAIPQRQKRKPKNGLFADFPLDNINGCLVLALVGLTFVIGSVVGGIVGGGMILWANGDSDALSSAITPTALPTPTPAPAATATLTPPPEPSPTPSTEDVIAGIIPSVVTVINHQRGGFSLNPDEGRVVGSGVIIDSRGYIATNNHVVESGGDLSIILSDGREVVAELVANEPGEDLAIVKITVENLPAIQWGDSTTVRPGQIVYAIGSPLGDFPNSVSFGVVSGLNRALEMDSYVIDGLIQTDAAINRGSSGGPLINIHGEMVGINTFIIRESEDRGVAEGIAFSIPAERARALLLPWIAAHSGESVPIPAAGEATN